MISPYILTTERRKPFDPRYVSQAFSAAAKRAGLEDVRFHDQRRNQVPDMARIWTRSGSYGRELPKTYCAGELVNAYLH